MRSPLLQLPAKNDPYFNNYLKGGINPCIVGNYPKNAKYPSGADGYNVLPNCTGWAVGEFARLGGRGKIEYFSKPGGYHAREFIDVARREGLEVGSVPKLGALIVWKGGSGYGHVAVVARVLDEDTIVVSESGWSSSRPMWTAVHRKGSGNWTEGDDQSWMKNLYQFAGFIYNPYMEGSEMSQEEFDKMADAWAAKKAKEGVSPWAESAMAEMKEKNIIVGDENGNQKPKSFATREEIAIIVQKILRLIGIQ